MQKVQMGENNDIRQSVWTNEPDKSQMTTSASPLVENVKISSRK